MKVLMIGMDGASRNTFDRGWTPYISKLLAKGNDFGLTTDLYSRGWTEIATGEHSSITSAMYDQPKCNGGLEWTEGFRMKNIPGVGRSVKPLWQKINENGYRVGIMNLPTTYPAPEVDGFFVSGGGGGAPVSREASEEMCFPRSVVSDLVEEGYIVDERIPQLVLENKLKTTNEIFERLSHKNTMRTNSFIRLAKKFDVEFGFVVYKTSSVLAESLIQVDWHKKSKGDESADRDTLTAIEKYYRKFDTEIEKLHSAFPEVELLFVADHGSTRREFSVNLNRFLVSQGFQIEKAARTSVVTVVNMLKKTLPFRLKALLKSKKGISHFVSTAVGFDLDNTQAFCRASGNWRCGIFINDRARFGGPVAVKDIAGIAARIKNQFNTDPMAVQHNITATVTGDLSESTSTWFPDIIVDLPDGYLITDKTKEFIGGYVAPNNATELDLVLRGEITNMKSTTPIAVSCGPTIAKVPYQGGGLTEVYRIVNSMFP